MSDIDSGGEMSSVEGVDRKPIDMDSIKPLTEQDVKGLIGKLESQAKSLTEKGRDTSSPYAKEIQDLTRGRMQQLSEILEMLGQKKAVMQISLDYKI